MKHRAGESARCKCGPGIGGENEIAISAVQANGRRNPCCDGPHRTRRRRARSQGAFLRCQPRAMSKLAVCSTVLCRATRLVHSYSGRSNRRRVVSLSSLALSRTSTNWDAPHCPELGALPNRELTAVLGAQQRLTALNIGLRGSIAIKEP